MSSILPFIYNPLVPPVFNPRLEQNIKNKGKAGEDAIVSVNVSIRDERASDTKEVLREALAHIDREFGGNTYA